MHLLAAILTTVLLASPASGEPIATSSGAAVANEGAATGAPATPGASAASAPVQAPRGGPAERATPAEVEPQLLSGEDDPLPPPAEVNPLPMPEDDDATPPPADEANPLPTAAEDNPQLILPDDQPVMEPEPAKPEPTKLEPAKPAPTKPPVKTAPAMPEPAKPEPARKATDEVTRDAAGVSATLRLVVTGGLDGLKTGEETFFADDLFQGGADAPVRIESFDVTALRINDVIFFTEGQHLTRKLLLEAAQARPEPASARTCLMGPNSLATTVDAPSHSGSRDRDLAALERPLAAVTRQASLQVRHVNGVEVWALDPSPQTPLVWPAPDVVVERVAAAEGTMLAGDGKGKRVRIFSRQKGSTPHTFGIVDALLAQPGMPATGYVDVGGALTSRRDSSSGTARAMQALILARHPQALGVGRAELVASSIAPDVLRGAPYVLAASFNPPSTAMPPPSRRARLGDHDLAFVALGSADGRGSALLPKDAQPLTSRDTTLLAGAQSADLVVGIGLSADGVEDALSSGNFDVIFSLASNRVAALPAIDEVDLRDNHSRDLHAGPILVRTSSADVSEVFVWLDASGRVERVRVVRHAVIDEGLNALDARKALAKRPVLRKREGLPARTDVDSAIAVWMQSDLDSVLGGIVRGATHAELSILEASVRPVGVSGKVPPELALSWLSQRAVVVTTTLRGDDLFKIFDAIGRNLLPGSVTVTGADAGARTVAQRPVMPLEWYRVAIARELLSSTARLGVRQPPVGEQAALDTYVTRALDAGLTAARVTSLLASAPGVPTHAFFLEVSDLALGVSIQQGYGLEPFSQVREGRLQAPSSTMWNADGTLRLIYDGPWVLVSGIFTSQYAKSTVTSLNGGATVDDELRDKALFESEAAFQLARAFHTSSTLTPMPLVRLAYESEWTPGKGVTPEGRAFDLPRRSEGRAFAGATLTPVPWITRARLGFVVQNDFAAATVGSFAWGGEAAIEGQWKIWELNLRIESYARAFVPDRNDTPDDLGVVSQTIARLALPVFADFSVSLFVDAYVATGKLEATRGPALSVIFGASLSSAQRLKLLPFLP